jgi:hypothetical protein
MMTTTLWAECTMIPIHALWNRRVGYEQLLAEHRVEDREHDDHREPAPLPPEEFLATVGVEELAKIPRHGSRESRYRLLEREEHEEGQHPQPHPSTHAARPRIAGRPQPQGIAYTRPAKCPQLAPDEDQDEQELPDEPCSQQKEESLR